MTRQQALDLYFLDARHKLVELAAFLDRCTCVSCTPSPSRTSRPCPARNSRPRPGSIPPSSARTCRIWGPTAPGAWGTTWSRSEEHTSELQSLRHLVCRL